jgi:hypothetical protein
LIHVAGDIAIPLLLQLPDYKGPEKTSTAYRCIIAILYRDCGSFITAHNPNLDHIQCLAVDRLMILAGDNYDDGSGILDIGPVVD